jgi:hypothetical protein
MFTCFIYMASPLLHCSAILESHPLGARSGLVLTRVLSHLQTSSEQWQKLMAKRRLSARGVRCGLHAPVLWTRKCPRPPAHPPHVQLFLPCLHDFDQAASSIQIFSHPGRANRSMLCWLPGHRHSVFSAALLAPQTATIYRPHLSPEKCCQAPTHIGSSFHTSTNLFGFKGWKITE